jgi:hypothetical protein
MRKNLLAIFMAGLMLVALFSAINVSAGLASSVSIQPKPIIKPNVKYEIFEALDDLDDLRDDIYKGRVAYESYAANRIDKALKDLIYWGSKLKRQETKDAMENPISVLADIAFKLGLLGTQYCTIDVVTAADRMEAPIQELRTIDYSVASIGLTLR